MKHSTFKYIFLRGGLGLSLLLALSACGASQNRTQSLQKLRAAMTAPVSSEAKNKENSRLVEDTLDKGVFSDMTRDEVAAAIGRGESCVNHPLCAEKGFRSSDWFYTVGQNGGSKSLQQPVFIVGFDDSGQVLRTWNLRLH